MNRLVDEHAKICYDIMQPEREVSLTENEVYLIDVVRSYDRYANFSEYFNDLIDLLCFVIIYCNKIVLHDRNQNIA